MSDETTDNNVNKKNDIIEASESNINYLSNILDTRDFKNFVALKDELKDTWSKKQIFRTETEARFSVLQDNRYPTKASKYWQCVREQSVYFENLMSLSFDYRRNEAKIKWLQKKIENENDDYKREIYEIDLDEKIYSKANMEQVAKDRMREIGMWSKLKTEFNDGTFDTKNVNTHQLETYHQVYQNKAKNITPGTSEAEVFNIMGQLQGLERIKRTGELKYDKHEELPRYGKSGEHTEKK